MNEPSPCRCDAFVHPEQTTNPPGHTAIRYRAGDYTSFRHAMLLSLPGEVELLNWKPTASSDLALQMVEWWAYLADILAFYNERIANQDYLRTADLDESVRRLIRLLGYRPRPGIGALATLAALANAKKPFTLPKGFAVQSKPGPGKKPQIFELDADTVVQPLSVVSADPQPEPAILGADGTVLLKGTVTSVKKGDQLLIVESGWNGTNRNYTVANVAGVTQEKDPRGGTNTRVDFGSPLGLPSDAQAENYRLLRSKQTTCLWQYNSADSALVDNGDGPGIMHLNSVVRQIHPGDMILFDGPRKSRGVITGSSAVAPHASMSSEFKPVSLLMVNGQGHRIDTTPLLQLSSVNAYTEILWYANSNSDPPDQQPTTSNTPGIAVLHSQLTFTHKDDVNYYRTALVIHYDWQEVGQLIPTPAKIFSGVPPELVAVNLSNFPPGSYPVLLEDAKDTGESATGFVGTDTTRTMQLTNLPDNPLPLAAPMNVLFNLMSMSRGKSVYNEILGSGDAGTSGQEFVLKNSPLTYLLSGDSSAGGNYKSTLRVWVSGIEWKAAPSFYGQPPDATVFVTREDENNQTHVQFGDGVHGARLPSGTNNVVASYRFGSGAETPEAGKLTVIATAQPGLTSIRNPVAAGGGDDPEPANQIRRYAPLSVLAFGRAVSGDDYEAIAALTPGVARARAYWRFDLIQQRTMVCVYVGNDAAAVNAVKVAFGGDADPNRPVVVKLATPVPVRILSLKLVVDAKYVPDDVVTATTQALTDPVTGLFGKDRVGIEEMIFVSRIYAACLSVPGALAVRGLQVQAGLTPLFRLSKLILRNSPGLNFNFIHGAPYRLDPGEGGYFVLDDDALTITPEVNNAG